MSFADQVREELVQLMPKKPCCRKSFACGLLINACFDEKKNATVRQKYAESAEVCAEVIRDRYGKASEVRSFGVSGHRFWDLTFFAPSFFKQQMKIASGEFSAWSDLLDPACDGCRSTFLRGLFLSCGTVNDPHKNFHLELILGSEAVTDFVSKALEAFGYAPRRIKRAHGIGLYYKDGASVEDLLTLMGAQVTVFEVINSRIEREIRNNENRATNCVAKNIEKTISASAKQMDAINLLMERGKLERLPEHVRTTAMLRYRNPDATLDELAFLHDPPISKSGLNHRLQRILQEAEDLL